MKLKLLTLSFMFYTTTILAENSINIYINDQPRKYVSVSQTVMLATSKICIEHQVKKHYLKPSVEPINALAESTVRELELRTEYSEKKYYPVELLNCNNKIWSEIGDDLFRTP